MDLMNENFIDNIITNLKILGLLQINEKLSIRKGHLQIDRESNIQGVRRWISRDSREFSLVFIKEIIRNINTLFYKLKTELPSCKQQVYDTEEIHWVINRILPELENSEQGLANLRTTYTNDTVISVQIENMIYKIRELQQIGKSFIIQ